MNYFGMVYISFKERTYGMAIMPLCCNIAWEISYWLVHPPKYQAKLAMFGMGLSINLGVMYAAIIF